jgi:hypothetical protein
MFCTVLILCFVLNLVSVYYLEVPVFVKILLFWSVCLSLLDMRCYNLPVVHLVSTDEALATESWRNNHPTINRGNAVKSLPRG